MARRAAVFGSFGQLGVELVRELNARGYEVKGWERAALDITHPDDVERAVVDFDPEVVFNSAAYNQVDVAEREPQAAFMVNALGVRNLALACRQIDAQLVHFSTDYVFDGMASRPYREDDPPHPLGAYAVSKLAGELYAKAYLDRALIVRTCGVFGPGGLHTNRGNFVELMFRRAAARQPIRVVEDHWLADLCAASRRANHRCGGKTAARDFSHCRRNFDFLVQFRQADFPDRRLHIGTAPHQ